jgi:hypothetical protein
MITVAFRFATDLLHAVERGQRLRASGVERRHAVGLVVLVEVGEVAGDDDRPHLLQLHEQAVVPRRVAGRREDDHGGVAEHVLVERQHLHLAGAADPVRERRGRRVGRRLRARDDVPVALADQQRRTRKGRDLAGVVRVVVADADEPHLLGLDVQLRELVDDADLRCDGARAHRVPGVPQQVVVAVPDEVAAVDEGHLQADVREGVGEARDIGGAGARAAVEARQRELRDRGLRHGRRSGEADHGADREGEGVPVQGESSMDRAAADEDTDEIHGRKACALQ